MPQSKARSRRKRVVRATNRIEDLASSAYLPLSADRREIRLLTLNPGHFRDDIHCSLSNFSLNECPPYEALSYVWGAGGSNRQIFVGGLPKNVTRNLEIALRHLRHVSQTRVLWIDAICIDQRDIPERNTQVIHMGDVYRSAFRVIAWLGEEDEDSDLAYDALEALPTDEKVHWDYSTSIELKKFLTAKHTTALGRLFRRAWWQRIWTVQESVLGSTLCFACGNWEISADVLCAVANSYTQHIGSCCQQSFWKEDINSELAEPMQTLDELAVSRASRGSHSLLWLLTSFTYRRCSDPRDKVFGLLGLCSTDVRKEIRPNYSTPVPLVYEQVALNVIKRDRSLDVFSQVCRRFAYGVELATVNLPSWVPDWTSEIIDYERLLLTSRQAWNDYFKASSGALASIRYVRQGRIVLKGMILGIVAVLGTPNSSLGLIESIYNNWRDVAGVEALPHRLYNKTSTTYYDAFWQTLCSSILRPQTSLHGSVKGIRTCNNAIHRSWYEAWCNWISDFDTDLDRIDDVSSECTGSEIQSFEMGVIAATSMRTLFISRDEEWLGLAPTDAIAGDVIALLEGGRVPYILRPGNETQAGCYQVIGDAYVHGVMDGESWNPELLGEIVLV